MFRKRKIYYALGCWKNLWPSWQLMPRKKVRSNEMLNRDPDGIRRV